MLKDEFLNSLRSGLKGLPENEVEDRISFYREMIEDRMDENMTEEEAVSALGPSETVAEQILSEVPLTKIVKERMKPKRKLKGYEIALIIVGSPIWLSLLIACIAVVIAVYAVIWAIVAVFWAIEAAFIVCALGGFAACIMDFVRGVSSEALLFLGGGLIFGGLSVFLFFGCLAVTKAMVHLTKWVALSIKKMFVRKEKDA